jgi:hypothetical protein
MTAPIRDMAGLVEAMKMACEEREISYATAGAIAGLSGGYVEKLFAHRPMKNLGYQSAGELLGALGKCLIMVDDPDAIPKVKNRWVKRKRVGSVEQSLSIALSIQQSEQEMIEFKAKSARREHMKSIGAKGGKRRLKTMKKRARQQIASHAARARWAKQGKGA